MAFYDGHFPPPSRPRRVAGGIRTRSRRGAIGETWWSRRFIDVLESFDMGSRLTRGRSYARSGQVLDLEVAAGSAAARVQGSRARPYEVWIELKLFWPVHWEKIERALAEQALYSAKLLAGEMPPDIESIFTKLGLSLFPDNSGELSMDCTCPDWAVPCKHIAATFYVLAEAFDTDPFLIFTWRGRTKEDLLDNLRELRGAADSAVGRPPATPTGLDALLTLDDQPLEQCLNTFWRTEFTARAVLAHRPAGDPVPDIVLRQLEPPPLEIRGRNLVDLLRPAYQAMASGVPPGDAGQG